MHYCLPSLYNDDDDDDDHTSGWGKEICEVGFANVSQKGFSICSDHHTMQRAQFAVYFSNLNNSNI